MALKKIGLALSGGGVRAATYHLGVLARLADDNLLDHVTAISSVSGGSWGAGLVFAMNDLAWPTSAEYFDKVIPKVRHHLITQNLETGVLRRLLEGILTLDWKIILSRSDYLSHLFQKQWDVKKHLKDLPNRPKWFINATCYETSESWRFERNFAGDSRFGYTPDTDQIRVSDALAASGAFPGLLGALPFGTRKLIWQDTCSDLPDLLPKTFHSPSDKIKRDDFPTLHLWDGGVFDNNGIAVFYDFDRDAWVHDVKFLVVSDASGSLGNTPYAMFVQGLLQIIMIMMQQVRQSRLQAILDRFSDPDSKAKGVYIPIDHSCEDTLKQAKINKKTINQIKNDSLPLDRVWTTKPLEARARQLTSDEFYILFRHGYEVADYTLLAFDPKQFKHTAFADSRWQAIVS